MKNISSDYNDLRLPRETQIKRMRSVMSRELTPLQSLVLQEVYFGEKTQVQLAQELGVTRSSVCHTLRRAKERLRRFLRY